ncbi:MAG: SpoVG family protein [Elusimicrobia bacterium]|nr:SpoVG family protein [Elusimicrobiota bacterium]
MMQITKVRIHLMNEERLKAFASITFDNCFVVRNMKIISGARGVFLCMPSNKLPNGTHKDIAHPVTQEFRKYLEENIIGAYEKELANAPASEADKVEKPAAIGGAF